MMVNRIDVESKITSYQIFGGRPTASYIPKIHVSDRHLHKEVEIAFVKKGALTIRILDEIDIAVHEGEAISISGSTLHKYMDEDPDTVIIKIKFMKEWLFLSFLDERERMDCQHLFNQVFVLRVESPIYHVFTDLVDDENQYRSSMFIFSRIIEFTDYALSHPEAIIRKESVNVEGTLHMEKILHFLQANSSDPNLTLPALAKHLKLSESYCSKLFSKNVKMTFVEYVNALRTNNAQYMLINTDCSITEIQEQVGFGSIQSFNRVFKQQTNMSPSEYRLALSKKKAPIKTLKTDS